MARVHILKETTNDPDGNWALWFQWCRYDLDDAGIQYGYRFIWRRPDGGLQGARGQARIPSLAKAKALMDKATQEGWGDRDGEALQAAADRLVGHGLVVSLNTGYVGWPNKKEGQLTDEMLADARMVREWT